MNTFFILRTTILLPLNYALLLYYGCSLLSNVGNKSVAHYLHSFIFGSLFQREVVMRLVNGFVLCGSLQLSGTLSSSSLTLHTSLYRPCHPLYRRLEACERWRPFAALPFLAPPA